LLRCWRARVRPLIGVEVELRDHLLPFHSSLPAPAAHHGWPVTSAWIGYEVEAGSVANEVAYWRDMTFLPHFLNLLGKRRVRAVVHFGTPLRNPDRKALARELHRAFVRLSETFQKAPVVTGELQVGG
jgi:hypothetical protein